MIIFHFFRFSISLVICSWTTTCRCVTTGMALYLSNQAESMCCLIYTCVAVRLLCIHKSLASAVCFDLWTGKSCCKLWLSHLYWSCWKCKCSPLSQLSMYDLFECEQMKVKKWECQNRCCHIYTMLASFHSLYIKKQSSDEDGRFPSTCSVVTLMLMNQARPLLDVGDTQSVTEWRKLDEMNTCTRQHTLLMWSCSLKTLG